MIKRISLLAMLFTSTTFFAQTNINLEGFESGNLSGTIWNDGGVECELVNNSLPNNNYAVKLTGGASDEDHTVYSNAIDLSSYVSVDISFDFQTTGYSGTDDFYLEYNIGAGWIKSPSSGFNIDASGVQFTNNVKYTQQKVSITASYTATTSFRFRSSASNDNQSAFLYIDNILIEGFGPIPPPTPSLESIVSGDVWRYLDDGSNLGTTWTGISFDDSAWEYGPSELGYGDGDEATDLIKPEEPRPITTYFRKEFSIADKSAYNSIDLEAVRDDGMVVYLNGTEVWKDGVDNNFDFSTLANQTIGGSGESAWISKNIAATALINGINVIAVEIHQVNNSSSDISFNFKLTPSTTLFNPLERGPYLQILTPTSVIVKWRTSVPSNSYVNYGTTTSKLLQVSEATLTTEHEIEITGLAPNTKYYYDIGNVDVVLMDGGVDNSMFVKTAPLHGTKQFVRMWALGDAGTEGQSQYVGQQKAVRDAYYNYVSNASSNPGQTDMMLFLGDNAYDNGSDADFQRGFFNGFAPILKNTVAWSCLGNHETYAVGGADYASASPYYDIFTFPTAGEAGGIASGTEAYYSYDYANIHFIVLESMSLYNDQGQKDWLTADIQNTSQDWIIAYFHHPPYTKGSHDSDDPGENGGMDEMREDFLPILEANGVDLVLSGHSHSYERSYFINGHYGLSDTFNAVTHAVGLNGDKSGKADTADGAYTKTATDTEGAVYVVTGSAGKISGFNQDGFHEAMYSSKNELGSSVIEIDSDGGTGQNLILKFIESTELITDYFTIHKTGTTLSTADLYKNDNLIKVYPVPANGFLNINLKANDNLIKVSFYDTIGKLVKETNKQQINIRNLKAGKYMLVIKTDQKNYLKSILIK